MHSADYDDSHAKALELADAFRTPRCKQLGKLASFVDCTQYNDRRTEWFDNGSEVPLWERKPCIVYPIVRSAIDSNVDLVLGEGRYPELTSRPDEDDETDEDESDLGEDESESLDRLIKAVCKESRFKAHSREILRQAQGTGSAAGIYGARNGRLFAEVVRAEWCEPEFEETDPKTVTRLVIQYPYLAQRKDPQSNKWKWKAFLYRRVIDGETDTVYKPFEITRATDKPDWVVDVAVPHGFGFCPVVWYAFLRVATTVEQIDGFAIHSHCLDEIAAHDYALSQRARAAMFTGDPQIYEIGVPAGYSPTETGRGAAVETWQQRNSAGDVVGIERSQWVSAGLVQREARKKGPGYVWQYPDKDVEVGILTLPPDALKAIDEHAHDLRQKIAESLCVVMLDPENIKFAATVSGKALETLRQRQLDRCDQIRDDFAENFILPAVGALLRVAAVYAANPERAKLSTPGLAKSAGLLAKFLTPETEAPNAVAAA